MQIRCQNLNDAIDCLWAAYERLVHFESKDHSVKLNCSCHFCKASRLAREAWDSACKESYQRFLNSKDVIKQIEENCKEAPILE